MANNEAQIKITADTAGLKVGLSEAKTALTNLRSEMSLINATFRQTGDKTEYLSAKYDNLKAQIAENQNEIKNLTALLEEAKQAEDAAAIQKYTKELNYAKAAQIRLETNLQKCTEEIKFNNSATGQLTNTIEAQERELSALKSEYQNVVLEQGKNSKEAKELAGNISSLSQELANNKRKMSEAENQTNSLDKSMSDSGKTAESSAKGGYTVFKDIVSDLASNTLQKGIDTVKEFAKETIESGMDFNKSMSKVKALSGATDEEFSKLKESASLWGESTIFTATDVSDAFGYMALAGWKTEDMLDGIGGVLNLAAAGEMDLAEASDIVTDYLTAFGLSAGDSADFVDKMTYAMANSNTDVSQLGEAYKNCAATASSLGYSVEDTTAVLMTMADAGFKGSEAGTGLSAIMTRLATNTKDCATELSKYGINVYDSQGNMNSLSEILNGVSEVWSSLTDKQQANLAKSIAGTSHYAELQTIMNGLSDETAAAGKGFNDYAAALSDCSGTASDMAHTMQDNLSGDITTLQSHLEGIKNSIEGDLDEPLRNLVQYTTSDILPIISETWNWLNENKDMLFTLGTVLAAIAIALGIHNALIALGSALEAAHATSLVGLIAAKWAENAANLALAASGMAALAPILLIVAAIAAVIAIIVVCIKHQDQIRAKVSEVSAAIKNRVTDLKDRTTEKINALKDNISRIVYNIKSVVIGVVNSIIGGVEHGVNKVIRGINRLITGINKIVGAAGSVIGLSVSIPLLSEVSLPRVALASGGLVTRPTTALVAEGGEPEAVMPVSVLRDYIQTAMSAVIRNVVIIDYALLAKAMAQQETVIEVDGRELGRIKKQA